MGDASFYDHYKTRQHYRLNPPYGCYSKILQLQVPYCLWPSERYSAGREDRLGTNYHRLDKLETLGVEPSQFCSLLRPVLSRFVKSFDVPASEDTINFWQRIAHYHWGGSGPSYYSGWITAFCFWNKDGKSLHAIDSPDGETLRLDGVAYHRIESDEVPSGYSSVPVTVDDNGDSFDAMMVAGSVGINCTSSGDELADGIVGLDTMSAETGWWMFERKSQTLLDEEKAEKIDSLKK